jgi:hypothetical protein
LALTVSSVVLTIKSGSPIAHFVASPQTRGGGMSAGLPCGAPLSTHLATLAISAALSDGSSRNFWMPMFFSTYQGGITPALGPIPVRCLMERAHGRTSS